MRHHGRQASDGGRAADLILSGVNGGQNVAEDVTYSGTIAAAMEGALLGIPAIALSQGYGGSGRDKIDWDCAATLGPEVIKRLLSAGMPPGVLVNVNFPACRAAEATGLAVTRQGRRDTELMQIEERRDGRSIPYYWLWFKRGGVTPGAGTDIQALAQKKVSITPLMLDLTDETTRARYAAAFGDA